MWVTSVFTRVARRRVADAWTAAIGRLTAAALSRRAIVYTTEILEDHLDYARSGLADQIEAFAENTMTYLRVEKELLLEGVGVPDVATQIEGRHVLIVVRGYDYRSDLAALRPYIRSTDLC